MQTGTVWTSLLKPAVLCMNSTQKKSHGTTPFRVMWGRDSRHADLVPVVNSVTVSSQDDIDTEEAILNHYDPLLDEFHSDNTFALPEHPDEDIAILDEFRETTYKLAGESICTEQLKQKRQYDKKVSLNRYCLRLIHIRYIQLYFRLDQKSKKVTVLSTLTCKN